MPPPLFSPSPLTGDDRSRLLLLARTALTETIVQRRLPSAPVHSGRLAEPGGAFVTLHIQGRLRGCVGITGRELPLGEAVIQAASGAGRSDPRFPAVQAAELDQVEIEISVLSEPERISADAVEVGRHGLLVIRGRSRGLLLPQVASHNNWTPLRFVEETCRKAGLGPDAWREPDTALWAFTAEVFSEMELPSVARSQHES